MLLDQWVFLDQSVYGGEERKRLAEKVDERIELSRGTCFVLFNRITGPIYDSHNASLLLSEGYTIFFLPLKEEEREEETTLSASFPSRKSPLKLLNLVLTL